MSTEGYAAFQAQLREDIDTVRELSKWARDVTQYVPNTRTILRKCELVDEFMDKLATILMMQVATPEEIERGNHIERRNSE